MPQGKETDAQFLTRVKRHLRLTQYQLAAMLGTSQARISRIEAGILPLAKLERAELRRRWAIYGIQTTIAEGRALTIQPCRGHTIMKFVPFVEHLEKCPMCLVRSFRMITGANKKGAK